LKAAKAAAKVAEETNARFSALEEQIKELQEVTKKKQGGRRRPLPDGQDTSSLTLNTPVPGKTAEFGMLVDDDLKKAAVLSTGSSRPNLDAELDDLKGENDREDVLIENIQQIKNELIPWVKAKMEDNLETKMKLSDIRVKKKVKELEEKIRKLPAPKSAAVSGGGGGPGMSKELLAAI
jgi:hypothetical protein